ncbi:hypothetical protein BK816_05715 [Boudabousia tangfeifanii]|uniref:DUF3040 domain-containing protein n=1 Tax=Boudabousia tangfeifanii TaxID=1912795 RepID=A0A1D9MKP7_9ACTO|nr:hypothetical protein BK816_05715 [Boudabousia tangfeifanii]
MGLSEHEQQIWDQMASSLEAELGIADVTEPLRQTTGNESKPTSEPKKKALDSRRILWGSLGALLGIVLLLVGVTLGYQLSGIIVGLVGIGFMVAGVYYALSNPFQSEHKKTDKPAKTGSFKAKQQEKFRQRGQQQA